MSATPGSTPAPKHAWRQEPVSYPSHSYGGEHDPRPQSMNSIGQRVPGKWCPDCGTELQWVADRVTPPGFWRCPWASGYPPVGGLYSCARPYRRKITMGVKPE
jgi:hypothetical protein